MSAIDPVDPTAETVDQEPAEEAESLKVNEDLLKSIQTELEQCMLKDNLMKDTKICAYMDAQLYISPSTFVEHVPSIKSLTEDANVILEAAKLSSNMTVDLEKCKIKPLYKLTRNTIILRDVPTSTTEEDIIEILKEAPCQGEVPRLKADINNTWFVSLDSEEVTTNVAVWLRSQKIEDNYIRSCIKSEHLSRTHFPPAEMESNYTPTQDMGYHPVYRYPPMPYRGCGMYWAPQVLHENVYHGGRGGAPVAMQANLPPGIEDNLHLYRDEEGYRGRYRGRMRGRKRWWRGRGALSVGAPEQFHLRQEPAAVEKLSHPSAATTSDVASLQLNSQNFPPLAAANQTNKNHKACTQEGQLPVGYQGEYRRYTPNEVKSICQNMEEIKEPDSLKKLREGGMASILTDSANTHWTTTEDILTSQARPHSQSDACKSSPGKSVGSADKSEND